MRPRREGPRTDRKEKNDGTIHCDVQLTGILSTGVLSPAEERPHGTRLTAAGLYAPGHQHFFVARLHMDVDGGNNTLHELSVQRDPRDASANAFGGAFRHVERELRDSAAARRLCDPAASRHWEVRSAERNRAGGACGWRLVPGRNVVPLAAADAVYRRRARFLVSQ